MRFDLWTSLACCVVFGAGCLTPKEDASRFYVLSSGGGVELSSVGDSAEVVPLVFVSPVSIPRYLEQPAMVTRVGEAEVVYSDLHFWAEPLGDAVTRRLREALVERVGGDRVYAGEVRRPTGAYVDLQVSVSRFEVDLAGEAVLVARWVGGGQPSGAGERISGQGVYRRQVTTGDSLQGARVVALVGCVDDMAGEIAGQLRGVVSGD
ncbi:MAG: hypothetical protein RI897_328 [Verrucomicrobiota bacterium]|jgi:uncharacterized lipoprotein YmbA